MYHVCPIISFSFRTVLPARQCNPSPVLLMLMPQAIFMVCNVYKVTDVQEYLRHSHERHEASLPMLACLRIRDCVFACAGEEALPGMDALASLTSLAVQGCPTMCALPTAIWQLTQLCCLSHGNWDRKPARLRRGEVPLPGVPTSAPCFASLTSLSLPGQDLFAFPPGLLATTRLTHLCLMRCCFEHLPEGMSVLSALETLELGRYAPSGKIGGSFDAQALGSLASFPNLQSLKFASCSVQFCPSFQVAAVHPCLTRLQLDTAFPAMGASCRAFLAFVLTLLQHERADVLVLHDSIVAGKGRRDSRSFRGGLRAMGFPLHGADLSSSSDEDASASDEE